MYFSFCYVLTYSIIYIIFQNIYIKIQISEFESYDKDIYIYIQLSEKYFIEKQLQTLKFLKWKIIIHFRFYPEKRRKIDKFMLKSIRKIVYVFFTYFKYYAIISI